MVTSFNQIGKGKEMADFDIEAYLEAKIDTKPKAGAG